MTSPRSLLRARLPMALGTVAVLVLAAGCGTKTASEVTASDDSATSSSTSSTGTGTGTGKTVACEFASSGQAARPVDKPAAEAPAEGTVSADIELNSGTLTATLDQAAAPCTVASFVSLAGQGFFDDTTCTRVTTAPGFEVLQCGDPSGTQAGGPGYTVPDEFTGKEKYPAGTLAMANTGQPDSGGSQFFIVYGDTQLPPQYTVFGTIDAAGLKVVEAIGKQGTKDGGQDGTPAEPVTITSVTVG